MPHRLRRPGAAHSRRQRGGVDEERVLTEWQQLASRFSALHNKSHRFYGAAHIALVAPATALSVVAGALSMVLASGIAATESSGSCVDRKSGGVFVLNVVSGIMALSSAGCTAIATSLKLGERSDRHKAAADEFEKLSRDIAVAMMLDATEERTYTSLAEFVKECNDRFNRLVDRSPPVREPRMSDDGHPGDGDRDPLDPAAAFVGSRSMDMRGRIADLLTAYAAAAHAAGSGEHSGTESHTPPQPLAAPLRPRALDMDGAGRGRSRRASRRASRRDMEDMATLADMADMADMMLPTPPAIPIEVANLVRAAAHAAHAAASFSGPQRKRAELEGSGRLEAVRRGSRCVSFVDPATSHTPRAPPSAFGRAAASAVAAVDADAEDADDDEGGRPAASAASARLSISPVSPKLSLDPDSPRL